jgi:hypothetical protein
LWQAALFLLKMILLTSINNIYLNYGPESKFTAETTTETVATANSAYEIAAGAYGQS